MPNGNSNGLPFGGCVLVKLPIVIADIVDSIKVDNVTCLDEMAKKVDHIDVRVEDLEADPVWSGPITGNPHHKPCTSKKATFHPYDKECGVRKLKSVNIHGNIHKQIYYVNRDDQVRHMSEDIAFTENIEPDADIFVDNVDNVDFEFKNVDIDVSFHLPRATRIQQHTTVSFTLKISEDQQLFIQTCIPDSGLIGTQLLSNASFETFTGCQLSDGWGQSNAAAGQPGRNNGYSVGLGGQLQNPGGTGTPCQVSAGEQASIFQNIPSAALRPGLVYEFCFWARDNANGQIGIVENYNLEARIRFLDANGQTINSVQTERRSFSQITNNWTQVCLTSTPVPEGTVSGVVEIVFIPETGNTAFVLIDDASLIVRRANGM